MSLLERFGQLIADPDEIQTLRSMALEDWSRLYVADEFKANLDQCLELIRDLGAPDRLGKIRAQYYGFKRVRRAATTLCNTFRLLDERHDPPENLDIFTWALGQLDDYLDLQLFDEAPKYIRILQNLLTNHLEFSLPESKQSSPELVMEYAKFTLTRASEILSKDPMLAPDAHELRKRLRTITNMFTLAKRQESFSTHAELLALANDLIAINDELGDIQDELVRKSMAGEIQYKKEKVVLARSLHEQIAALLLGTQRD